MLLNLKQLTIKVQTCLHKGWADGWISSYLLSYCHAAGIHDVTSSSFCPHVDNFAPSAHIPSPRWVRLYAHSISCEAFLSCAGLEMLFVAESYQHPVKTKEKIVSKTVRKFSKSLPQSGILISWGQFHKTTFAFWWHRWKQKKLAAFTDILANSNITLTD